MAPQNSTHQHFSFASQKWKRIDFILMLIQMASFMTAFILLLYLRMSSSIDYLCSPREVICVSIGLVIKLVRTFPLEKSARKIALSQIKFYTPYILTIMECVFKYFSQPHQRATEVQINLYLIFLIIKNIYYSFLTHIKLTSFIEAFVASATLMAWVALGVFDLMTSVYVFDNQVENDYKKDLVLLFLTTLIANSAMMMDLIFRPVQELINIKEEEEEEREKGGSKEHLKNEKECPHCHNDTSKKPHESGNDNPHQHQPHKTPHHQQNNRSYTQTPFNNDMNTRFRQSKHQASKSAMRKTYNNPMPGDRFSIREEIDTSRDIQLSLIGKNQ